jgi:hypothetical protein
VPKKQEGGESIFPEPLACLDFRVHLISSVFVPALSAAELVGIALSGYLASTLLRDFHTTVLGIHIGPVDTIFTAVGISLAAAGIYALVNLRGVRLAQGPAHGGNSGG